jgi:hypothetical protein
MRAVYVWILTIALLPVAGFGGTDTNAIDPDIAEAVLRYQFQTAGAGTNIQVYYIAVAGKDPDDEFMKRFKDYRAPVKRGSECKTKAPSMIDKKNTKLGWVFGIYSVVFVSDDHAEAKGGDWGGDCLSSQSTFYLKRDKGKWIVDYHRIDWQSNNSPNQEIQTIAAKRVSV